MKLKNKYKAILHIDVVTHGTDHIRLYRSDHIYALLSLTKTMHYCHRSAINYFVDTCM